VDDSSSFTILEEFHGSSGQMDEVRVVVPRVPGEFSRPKKSGESDGEGCSEVDVIVEVGVEGSEHGEEEGTVDFSTFSDWLCTEYTKGAAEYSVDSGIVKDSGGEAEFDVVVLDSGEIGFDGLGFCTSGFDDFGDPAGKTFERGGSGKAAVE
jgi:hypothetical protein